MLVKGYTMIEMLFCLLVVIVLMNISINFVTYSSFISIKEISNDILNMADYTRLKAMVYKQTEQMSVENSYIDSSDYKFYFDQALNSVENNILRFNQYGNLGKGQSLSICYQQCVTLVFNVGSGASYEKR